VTQESLSKWIFSCQVFTGKSKRKKMKKLTNSSKNKSIAYYFHLKCLAAFLWCDLFAWIFPWIILTIASNLQLPWPVDISNLKCETKRLWKTQMIQNPRAIISGSRSLNFLITNQVEDFLPDTLPSFWQSRTKVFCSWCIGLSSQSLGQKPWEWR
jgi:hypothetical protein